MPRRTRRARAALAAGLTAALALAAGAHAQHAFHRHALIPPPLPERPDRPTAHTPTNPDLARSDDPFPEPVVRYVDAAAAPGGDGLSWATAYQNPEDALQSTTSQRNLRLLIAQGVYTPRVGPDDPANSAPAFSFDPGGSNTLDTSVEFIGGFPAGGAPLEQRDPHAYPTILSGDINNDDGPNFTNRDDNAPLVLFTRARRTTIDGLTVRGGHAPNRTDYDPDQLNVLDLAAGGLRAVAEITIAHARFTDNLGFTGGAVATDVAPSHDRGVLRVRDSVFENNRAVQQGGALFLASGAQTQIVRSRFSRNAAPVGGAVAARDVDLNIAHAVFTANRAESDDFTPFGGALFAFDGSFGARAPGEPRIQIVNSLFYGNSAPDGFVGGAWFANNATIQNTVFSHNSDMRGDGADAQLSNHLVLSASDSAPPNFTTVNLVRGWADPARPGHTILDQDPRFRDPLGPDGVLGTDDDDFSPVAGSPLIDAGAQPLTGGFEPVYRWADPEDLADLDLDGDTDEPAPDFTTLDFRRNPRNVDVPSAPNAAPLTNNQTDLAVDLGPIEYQADCNDNGVLDADEIDSGALADADHSGVPDACEPFDDCNNNTVEDGAEIADDPSLDRNSNGRLDACELLAGELTDLNGNQIADEFEPQTLRVSPLGDDANTGLTWAEALASPQEAFDRAAGREAPTEIWLAAGNYSVDGPATDLFTIPGDVTLLGGFNGSELDPRDRGPQANVSTLHADGRLRTAVLANPGAPLLIDGVRFTGANAVRPPREFWTLSFFSESGDLVPYSASNSSGALLATHPDTTISRCIFELNHAGADAAVSAEPGVTIRDSHIRNNTSTAGLVTLNSIPDLIYGAPDSTPAPPITTVENCTFAHNTAGDVYGFDFAAPARVDDCTFTNNDVGPFGSVVTIDARLNDDGSATRSQIRRSRIAGNTARRLLAGRIITSPAPLYDGPAPVSVEDTLLVGPAEHAAWFLSTASTPTLNSAGHPAPVLSLRNVTIAGADVGLEIVENSFNPTAAVENSIIDAAADSFLNTTLGGPAAPFAFNIATDLPDLTIGANAADNTDADPLLDPDYIPTLSSPAVDSADNTRIPQSVTTDAAGATRFYNEPFVPDTGVADARPPADRGALERAQPCPGDLDRDGDTDVADFFLFAASFGDTVPPGSAGDADGDRNVTLDDFMLLANDFGCTP